MIQDQGGRGSPASWYAARVESSARQEILCVKKGFGNAERTVGGGSSLCGELVNPFFSPFGLTKVKLFLKEK
jgi:hypothetical protein